MQAPSKHLELRGQRGRPGVFFSTAFGCPTATPCGLSLYVALLSGQRGLDALEAHLRDTSAPPPLLLPPLPLHRRRCSDGVRLLLLLRRRRPGARADVVAAAVAGRVPVGARRPLGLAGRQPDAALRRHLLRRGQLPLPERPVGAGRREPQVAQARARRRRRRPRAALPRPALRPQRRGRRLERLRLRRKGRGRRNVQRPLVPQRRHVDLGAHADDLEPAEPAHGPRLRRGGRQARREPRLGLAEDLLLRRLGLRPRALLVEPAQGERPRAARAPRRRLPVRRGQRAARAPRRPEHRRAGPPALPARHAGARPARHGLGALALHGRPADRPLHARLRRCRQRARQLRRPAAGTRPCRPRSSR